MNDLEVLGIIRRLAFFSPRNNILLADRAGICLGCFVDLLKCIADILQSLISVLRGFCNFLYFGIKFLIGNSACYFIKVDILDLCIFNILVFCPCFAPFL